MEEEQEEVRGGGEVHVQKSGMQLLAPPEVVRTRVSLNRRTSFLQDLGCS